MTEVNLNAQLVELLVNHGVSAIDSGDFVYAGLPQQPRFSARAYYQEADQNVSSQLNVTATLGDKVDILECFGDVAPDINTAINRNLVNFTQSTFHVLLTAFGGLDALTQDSIDIDEWEIDGQKWIVYLGNLSPKSDNSDVIHPPEEFYNTVSYTIKSLKLNNDIHWFRGYYLQYDGKIYSSEFLMDNQNLPDIQLKLNTLPVLSGVNYYSCRIFIILKRKH